MNDKPMKKIREQLPEGAKILRSYRAFEGDIRVIVKLRTDRPKPATRSNGTTKTTTRASN